MANSNEVRAAGCQLAFLWTTVNRFTPILLPLYIPQVSGPMCIGNLVKSWPTNCTCSLLNLLSYVPECHCSSRLLIKKKSCFSNSQRFFSMQHQSFPFALQLTFSFLLFSLTPSASCMLVSAAVFLIKRQIHRETGISFRALHSSPLLSALMDHWLA